jgi:hypothetical protein
MKERAIYINSEFSLSIQEATTVCGHEGTVLRNKISVSFAAFKNGDNHNKRKEVSGFGSWGVRHLAYLFFHKSNRHLHG